MSLKAYACGITNNTHRFSFQGKRRRRRIRPRAFTLLHSHISHQISWFSTYRNSVLWSLSFFLLLRLLLDENPTRSWALGTFREKKNIVAAAAIWWLISSTISTLAIVLLVSEKNKTKNKGEPCFFFRFVFLKGAPTPGRDVTAWPSSSGNRPLKYPRLCVRVCMYLLRQEREREKKTFFYLIRAYGIYTSPPLDRARSLNWSSLSAQECWLLTAVPGEGGKRGLILTTLPFRVVQNAAGF